MTEFNLNKELDNIDGYSRKCSEINDGYFFWEKDVKEFIKKILERPTRENIRKLAGEDLK